MKKKMLLIILILLFTIDVNAMTLTPTGVDNAQTGEDIEIYLTLNKTTDEKQVSAVDGVLKYDEACLTLKEQTGLLDNWTKWTITNSKPFAYANITYDNLVVKTKTDLIKLIFTISGNDCRDTNIIIDSPSATDEYGDPISIEGGSHTINISSNINTLSNIKIDNQVIEGFKSDILEYSYTVTKEEITITADKTNANSTVEGLGTKKLNYGLNTFKILVASEVGTTKEYILNINRLDDRSKVNTLKTLSLSSGTLDFKPEITTYDVIVGYNVQSVDISSTLTDEKATYVSEFGNRKVNLQLGSNEVLIKVQAENGDIKTYTLNITKIDDRSKVNTLKTLSLSSGTINFNSDTTDYNIIVGYEIENIEIYSTLTDNKASYVEGYGNRKVDLKVGTNEVLLQVKAENGNIKTYKINIIRENYKSNINTLKTLSLSNGTINFNPETTTYNITVGYNVQSVEISSTLTDVKASYVAGFGNRKVDLQFGLNKVLLKVKAENGEIKTYTLNITRVDERSNINTLSSLTLSSGTINFNPETITYNITVGYEVQNIEISSTLTDKKASYVEGYGNRKVDLYLGLNVVVLKVQAENGDVKTYILNITRVDERSNINTLSSLRINSGTINFKSETTTYNITLGYNDKTIRISSTLTDNKSSYVEGFGNREIDLKFGLNVILIKVQAENGKINIYTLNVVRNDNRSNINTLSSLTVNNKKIEINPNVVEYDITIGYNVENLEILSTLTDSKSTYVNGYGNRSVRLYYGLNEVLLKVQAENGDIKTYTLNITKIDDRSTINTLKSLKLSAGTINFDSKKEVYDLIINSDVSKIKISSELTDSKSSYVEGYGNREVSLNFGSNIIFIKVKAENGNVKTYTLNITREDNKSKVNTLKSLKIINAKINFEPNTLVYDIDVLTDVESVQIISLLADSKSSYVEGYGNRTIPLNLGLNEILLKIQAENGDVRTYTLNITRKDERSSVNTLKSLILSNGELKFDSNIENYDVKVGNDVEKIQITSELTDFKSSYVEGYGDRIIPLNFGLNKVFLKVKAENGDIKTYILNITREDNRSNVNTLKSLSLSRGTINFKSEKTIYDIEVLEDVEKVTITSELTDPTSKYIEGFENREISLNYGLNQVLIKIQAENGDLKTYTLNIIRNKKDDEKVDSAYIKRLTIENYDIDFSSYVFEYDITIKSEKSLDFIITLDNEDAYYEILNNENLTDGKTVIIKVTSANQNTVNEYKFNIIKDNDNLDDNIDDNTGNNNQSFSSNYLSYIFGICILLIGITLLYIAIKNKQKNHM